MSRPIWIEDRWHLEGRPIHAGNVLQIRWPDGTWEAVRIETGKTGLRLFAHCDHHGEEFVVEVDDTRHALRWQ
jgi:hypothetical protein